MNLAKIVHIDTGREWRGGQQQSTYLHNGLIERSFKSAYFYKTGSQIHQRFCDDKTYHRVELFNEFDIFTARKIANFININDFNIIHCHTAHGLTIGIIASYLSGRTKIIATRRVEFPIKNTFSAKFKYKNKLVSRIVCISEAIRQVMINSNIDTNRLVTIHSGINLNRFESDKKLSDFNGVSFNGRIIVGTIAAFDGNKDYDNLLEAAKIVLDNRDNVIFLAVGSGKLFDGINAKVNYLGLNDSFIFAGEQKNVGQFLHTFDIFTLASKKEGLGTSILDAMAVGLPIAATCVGGIPEAVLHNYNGLLVPPSRPDELANNILRLIDDKEFRISCGNNSLRKVQHFDINNTIKQNIQLYEQILAE